MVMLVQNETDKFRVKMLTVEIFRQLAENVFAVSCLIGCKKVFGIMQLYFKPLNNKRVIAFKLGSVWNIFQRDGNSFVNLQLSCFLPFFRTGPFALRFF
jgi:hypothetical protein